MVAVRKGRARPKNETQVLREMGELRGGELAQCMKWWRMDYDDANDVSLSAWDERHRQGGRRIWIPRCAA